MSEEYTNSKIIDVLRAIEYQCVQTNMQLGMLIDVLQTDRDHPYPQMCHGCDQLHPSVGGYQCDLIDKSNCPRGRYDKPQEPGQDELLSEDELRDIVIQPIDNESVPTDAESAKVDHIGEPNKKVEATHDSCWAELEAWLDERISTFKPTGYGNRPSRWNLYRGLCETLTKLRELQPAPVHDRRANKMRDWFDKQLYEMHKGKPIDEWAIADYNAGRYRELRRAWQQMFKLGLIDIDYQAPGAQIANDE